MTQELESTPAASVMPAPRAAFSQHYLGNGAVLFLHETDKFKSTTIDLFLRTGLEPGKATRIALIGRLLERGTRRWPDMRAINRFLDDMYGASFAVDVEQVADQQVVHASFDVINGHLVGEPGLLSRLFEFAAEVVGSPAGEEGFRPDYVEQEKRALDLAIRSLYSDKTAYAHRRCFELMCANEPAGVSAMGAAGELPGVHGAQLYETYRQLLNRAPMEIFVTGPCDASKAARLCEQAFGYERCESTPLQLPELRPARKPPLHETESQRLHQGRLVQGYRTAARLGGDDYAPLLLMTALLGGDAYSRLFKSLRESSGLCYAIESQLDPLGGFLFVEAGIDVGDVTEATHRIAVELELLQDGVTEQELDRVRGLATRRLQSLGDSRAGLVRLGLHGWLTGGDVAAGLAAGLCHVGLDDIARVAAGVDLDTTFYLH